MKRRLLRHRAFKRDALKIFTYIGENDLPAARRFLHNLDSDVKRLAEMPGLGAIREFEHPKLTNLRSLPVSAFENYLIFYRITEDEVQLLRLIHGARDLESALAS